MGSHRVDTGYGGYWADDQGQVLTGQNGVRAYTPGQKAANSQTTSSPTTNTTPKPTTRNTTPASSQTTSPGDDSFNRAILQKYVNGEIASIPSHIQSSINNSSNQENKDLLDNIENGRVTQKDKDDDSKESKSETRELSANAKGMARNAKKYVPLEERSKAAQVLARNTVDPEREQNAALDNLKSYKSVGQKNPITGKERDVSYNIVKFLRDNPTANAERTLKAAGFSNEDIQKAKEEAAKPISLEEFNRDYLQKKYGKNYEEVKSRKQLKGESDTESLKRFKNNGKILAEATEAYTNKYGKGALALTGIARVSELFFQPARVIRPEVELKDIRGYEWAIGAGQLALTFGTGLASKALSPVTTRISTVGKLANAAGKANKEMKAALSELNKTPMTSKSYTTVASNAQKAVQTAKVADQKFIAKFEQTALNKSQLKQIEKLSGYKGITQSSMQVQQAQSQLTKAYKAVQKAKPGTEKYSIRLNNLEKARSNFSDSLAQYESKLNPRAKLGEPAGYDEPIDQTERRIKSLEEQLKSIENRLSGSSFRTQGKYIQDATSAVNKSESELRAATKQLKELKPGTKGYTDQLAKISQAKAELNEAKSALNEQLEDLNKKTVFSQREVRTDANGRQNFKKNWLTDTERKELENQWAELQNELDSQEYERAALIYARSKGIPAPSIKRYLIKWENKGGKDDLFKDLENYLKTDRDVKGKSFDSGKGGTAVKEKIEVKAKASEGEQARLKLEPEYEKPKMKPEEKPQIATKTKTKVKVAPKISTDQPERVNAVSSTKFNTENENKTSVYPGIVPATVTNPDDKTKPGNVTSNKTSTLNQTSTKTNTDTRIKENPKNELNPKTQPKPGIITKTTTDIRTSIKTKIPTREFNKPPKKVLLGGGKSEDDKTFKPTAEDIANSTAVRMGIGWWLRFPNGKFRFYRELPSGVQNVKAGKGSAYESVQTVTGKPIDVIEKIGFMNVHFKRPGRNPGNRNVAFTPSNKIGKPRTIKGVGVTRRVRTGKILRGK